MSFERVPFDHPLWVLYSSGTTGLPKAIVQGQGGILLEHLKKLHLHVDAHPGDRLFWFTTTGWMMWNFLVSGLLTKAAIVLYDGNPGHPDMGVLWDLAERAGVTMFGTSASYIAACMKAGVEPGAGRDLSRLGAVGSTGSPLSPEGFDWIYEHLGADTWLFSTSGGTDLCTAFVGGVSLLPVYRGELQGRALGAAVEAWDEDGNAVVDEVGELVVTAPMPSMPVRFWGDADGSRYRASYFEMYPGVWRHGDWIEITSRGTAIIYGRSDSTINRSGIRMGTSEIYRAVLSIDAIVDALVVDVPRPGTDGWMPLFVVLREGDRAGRGAAAGDRPPRARALLAAPRPRRGLRDRRGAPNSERQGAGGAGEADPDGHPSRAGGQPRLARQPGGARLLRRDGGRPGELSPPRRPLTAFDRAPRREHGEAPARGDKDAADHVAREMPAQDQHREADRGDQAQTSDQHCGPQRGGATKAKAIAIEAAAVACPLGKAIALSWCSPSTGCTRGWASRTLSSCVVRLAPATTVTAARASSGRRRQSAIPQASASISSSGSGSPRWTRPLASVPRSDPRRAAKRASRFASARCAASIP